MTTNELKAAFFRSMTDMVLTTDVELKALKAAHIQKQAKKIFALTGEVFTTDGWVKA